VLALLGLPLLSWWLLQKWHVSAPVPYLGGMIGGAVLGLLLLPLPAQLTRGLASLDIAVARYLIGPGGSTDQTERITELEQSRARVVDAAEAERRRIERDLHDGAQQRLVSLAMNLGRAKARFADDPDGAREIIEQAHTEAKEALAELRNLVRGVHPPVLSDRGLDAAISGLAALCPVPVTVHADTGPRPPVSAEAIAYFVVAEALTNVAKHAHASRADVSVTRHGDVLRVLIRDDGAGGANPHGQGLAGLADRLAGVDGRLSVRSPDGGPTVIEAELPCRS
jgi:signal transduction histidine kinase